MSGYGRSWRTGGEARIAGSRRCVAPRAGATHRRQVRRTVGTFGYVLVAYSTAAVILLIWAIAIRSPLSGYPAQSWMWIALAGLGPSVIGHTLYNRALKDFSAHTVATTILGEPIVATALAALVLSEYPSPWAYVGTIPIAIGVIWAIGLERKVRREHQQHLMQG